MLNIRQIEVFKAIMDTGSVSAAARHLNVSQPSVSKQLALLESRLGLALFRRTGNRLLPRPEALALQARVDRVYSGLDRLNAFLSDLSQNRQGEVQVAAMPLIAHKWLPDVLAPFLHAHPMVSATLPVRSSRWIAEWVAAGRVDLGIGLANDMPGLTGEPLLVLPMVAVMAADHRLAGTAPLDAAELTGQSVISLTNFDFRPGLFDDLLEEAGARPARRIRTFTSHVACELARKGLGVALVDALTALDLRDAGLCLRRLERDTAIEVMLLSPANWPRDNLTERLMGLIRDAARRTAAAIDRDLPG